MTKSSYTKRLMENTIGYTKKYEKILGNVQICCKCDSNINLEKDSGYGTRLVWWHKKLRRMFYCGTCLVVGRFP